MPKPNLNHFHPTWNENYTPLPIGMPDGNYGMAVRVTLPTFHGRTLDPDPLLSYHQPPGEGGSGIDQIPQTQGKENFQPSSGPDILNRFSCRAKAHRKVAQTAGSLQGRQRP